MERQAPMPLARACRSGPPTRSDGRPLWGPSPPPQPCALLCSYLVEQLRGDTHAGRTLTHHLLSDALDAFSASRML